MCHDGNLPHISAKCDDDYLYGSTTDPISVCHLFDRSYSPSCHPMKIVIVNRARKPRKVSLWYE